MYKKLMIKRIKCFFEVYKYGTCLTTLRSLITYHYAILVSQLVPKLGTLHLENSMNLSQMSEYMLGLLCLKHGQGKQNKAVVASLHPVSQTK